MNRLLVIIAAAYMAVGCCPVVQLATDTVDSVRVETVVKYERVLDTVYIEVPVEIVRETVRDSTSHLETSFAKSDACINPDGSLYHSLENKPQNRPVEIETEIIYRDSIVYRDRVETKIVEVPRDLTWWQQTKMKGFWAMLTILAILLLRKRFSKYIRMLFG